MKKYDIAIIGSGPGGYAAGLYASRHKLNVCVIEKDVVGGTCLNRGCIPTKSLVNSAALLSAVKEASNDAVDIDGYSINFDKAVKRKDGVVSRLRAGIEALFRAASIDLIRGTGSLVDSNTIEVEGADRVGAKNIIIASGSRPAGLSGLKIDEAETLSSDGILNLKSIPESILVIGGGVIGCEFASLFNAFGAKVAIVECMDRILPGQSREASKKLELIFKRRGIDVRVSQKALDTDKMKAQKVLVAVGRSPYTEGLGIERMGIKTEGAKIAVDRNLRTNIKNIYAIGDCVSGPLLAHKASYDGILACDNILGKDRSVDYSNIPNCIWTEPEIASVGMSEEEARSKCPDAKIAKFPYLASGKAAILSKTEGFVKLIADGEGDILGIEIFGHGACELIGEAVLAKTMNINIKDWAGVVHGHPTLSELFQEAAHNFA